MIEVNGIKYQEKKKPKVSKKLHSIMLLTYAMGGMYGSGEKERERPKVDIIKEYGLIQQKKSDLTKSQRDWVEYEFNKNFEKIPKP